MCRGNLISDQGIFSLVIISLLLITWSLDNVWISFGKIDFGHPWDLKDLGLYGLWEGLLKKVICTHRAPLLFWWERNYILIELFVRRWSPFSPFYILRCGRRREQLNVAGKAHININFLDETPLCELKGIARSGRRDPVLVYLGRNLNFFIIIPSTDKY